MWKRWSREVCIPQYQALLNIHFDGCLHHLKIIWQLVAYIHPFQNCWKNRNNVIQIHIVEELGSALKWRDGKLYVLARKKEIAKPLFFCIKIMSPRWQSNKIQSIKSQYLHTFNNVLDQTKRRKYGIILILNLIFFYCFLVTSISKTF